MLNQKSGENVYFAFIQSCINYGNIAFGSTYKTKLKKIFTYQKKVARVIFLPDHLAHVKPLMLDMNALNVYKMKICQNLILLYKAHTGTAPSIVCTQGDKNLNHENSRRCLYKKVKTFQCKIYVFKGIDISIS